jgi:hypothetical protein
MPTPLGYIDHRPFAGFGAGLIYGRRPDGSLVRVDEVPRGLACNCVCPAPDCAQPLIASKGKAVTHHFRHAIASVGCGSGAETSAHIWAKEVLEREKAIWLPAIEGTYHDVTVTTHPKQRFRFDAVRLETRMGELVPDVVLSKGDRELIVEVQVTHACDPAKIAMLEAAGVSALEVDLKAYRTSTDEEAVRKAILSTAPRRWLVNPKLAEAAAAAQAKAAALKAEKRRVADEAARDLRERLGTAPKMADARYRPACDLTEALGLGHLLESPEPALSGFAVEGPVWRAAVIQRVVLPATAPGNPWWKPTVDPDQAAEAIRDLWALPLRPTIPTEVLAALARQPYPIIHPRQAVSSFIEELVKEGLLFYAKGDYSVPDHHRQVLRQGAMAIAAREKRASDIAEKIQAILNLADEDELAAFSLDDWMQRPAPGFARSPGVLIDEGGSEFDRLEAGLHRLEPMPWSRSIPTDALGLPVQRHLEREAEVQRAIEAAAEAARKAEAKKARLGRRERIGVQATTVLGWSGQEWLDACPMGLSTTRREIASSSDEGFGRVWNAIERLAHDRQLEQQEAAAMERRQAVLRRKASAVLGEAHAAFFLDNRRSELGRCTPLQACKTDRGLEEAVALLPAGRRKK